MSEGSPGRVGTARPVGPDVGSAAPGPDRDAAPGTARRSFHVLLGAIFVPLLSLPFVWASGLRWLRRPRDDHDRLWAKRILALAVVDTLLVIIGIAAARGAAPSDREAGAPRPRVMIGVTPDPSYGGPGVRIRQLFPDGPAATAGLENGDVILHVAGQEISSPDALRALVAEQEPGVPIPVEVMRGTSTSTLDVTPRWSSEMRRPRIGALDPVKRSTLRECFLPPAVVGLVPLAIVLGAIAALAILVARRVSDTGAARGVWWTGLSLIAASLASYAVPAGACALLGGVTAAGGASAVWASSLALCGTALVARRVVREVPGPVPSRTWGSAVRTGIWYLITGAPRMAVLSFAAMQLAGGREMGSGSLESFVEASGSAPGPALWLLAMPAVLIAPVGEEVAFRGLLQPALGRCLSPAAAVAVTSVVFASMHWYYGFKLPIIAFLAVVLGWARVASGGLRAPILLHALVNAASFVAMSIAALQRG